MEPFSTDRPLNAAQARRILVRAYDLSRESFRYGVSCAQDGESDLAVQRDRRDSTVVELLNELAALMPHPDDKLINVTWQAVLSERLQG